MRIEVEVEVEVVELRWGGKWGVMDEAGVFVLGGPRRAGLGTALGSDTVDYHSLITSKSKTTW